MACTAVVRKEGKIRDPFAVQENPILDGKRDLIIYSYKRNGWNDFSSL